MRKKATLTAFIAILLTGCQTTSKLCDAYSNCDEFYPYNCPDSARTVYYTPREYKKYVSRHWDYSSYYPNTQSVYYTPVIINSHEVLNSSSVTKGPRPDVMRGNSRGNSIESVPNGIHRKPTSNASYPRKKRD